MARRAAEGRGGSGQRKGSAKATRSPPAKTTAAVDLKVRVAALERERAALAADLEAARARITDLETRQGEIADRIAWALDSLHDLIGDEA